MHPIARFIATRQCPSNPAARGRGGEEGIVTDSNRRDPGYRAVPIQESERLAPSLIVEMHCCYLCIFLSRGLGRSQASDDPESRLRSGGTAQEEDSKEEEEGGP